MDLNNIQNQYIPYALSPLDGRYQLKLKQVSSYFNDFALTKTRLMIEIEWIIFFVAKSKINQIPKLTTIQKKKIRKIYLDFTTTNYQQIKKIEFIIKHDIKAIETFLQQELLKLNLSKYLPLIHIGLTSEDINSVSYAYNIQHFIKNVALDDYQELSETLNSLGKKWKKNVMISHTHGQVASPTTLGKEILVFVKRLEKVILKLSSIKYLAKFSGTVGNFNSLSFSLPKLNWEKITDEFVAKMGLIQNKLTTQIEPHDSLVELFNLFSQANSILIDFCRDTWMYIMLGYLKQTQVSAEVGSSTMPHKINPINFENAEGNLGIANALYGHFATKLPISRLQRDLSDSTVMRNIGVSFGHSIIALKSIKSGLTSIHPNKLMMDKDLNENWQLLAEPLQTELRLLGLADSYERVKLKTRGLNLNKKEWISLVKQIKLPKNVEKRILDLTPIKYVGNAKKSIKK